MDEADSEKLDGAGEAGEAGGTKKDASDSEKLDEAGTAGGTQTDEADLEKLDEAGGSKMDADEEEEVAPKIEEETIGDPNEPAKTDEGEVQVNPSGHAMEDKDEEMESPQDGANSEVKDSKDDSSKETSSQQGQSCFFLGGTNLGAFCFPRFYQPKLTLQLFCLLVTGQEEDDAHTEDEESSPEEEAVAVQRMIQGIWPEKKV